MSTHDAHDPHPQFCRTCGGPLVLGEPEFDHGYDPQTGAPEMVRRLRCVNRACYYGCRNTGGHQFKWTSAKCKRLRVLLRRVAGLMPRITTWIRSLTLVYDPRDPRVLVEFAEGPSGVIHGTEQQEAIRLLLDAHTRRDPVEVCW